MRLLGIDYGDKKIGTAFGELTTRVAVPLDIIPNIGEDTIEQLVKQIKEEDIERVIVGAPLSTGSHHDSEQLNKTRAFVATLRDAIDVEIIEEDESYTTTQSIHLQKEEGVRAGEDALAAMLILQAYMNKQ